MNINLLKQTSMWKLTKTTFFKFILLVIITATMGLVSCSQQQTTTSPPEEAKTEEPVATPTAPKGLEHAYDMLTQANANMKDCMTVLGELESNPKVNDILTAMLDSLHTKDFDFAKVLSELSEATGKKIDLTTGQFELCAKAYSIQYKVQLETQALARSNADSEACSAADCPGQYYCPNPSSMCGICCPSANTCTSQCAGVPPSCFASCQNAPACFPSDAIVKLENGSNKTVGQLEIGDKVQVVTESGEIAYEDIYLFTHNDPFYIGEYIELTLISGKKLELSPRHFIPVSADGTDAWQPQNLAAANEVALNDVVWYLDHGQLASSKVAFIDTKYTKGAFNPMTSSGMIVVNGVVASTHSDWFLDGHASVPTQARVYQGIFTIANTAYNVIGAENMHTVTNEWGVVDFIREKTQ